MENHPISPENLAVSSLQLRSINATMEELESLSAAIEKQIMKKEKESY